MKAPKYSIFYVDGVAYDVAFMNDNEFAFSINVDKSDRKSEFIDRSVKTYAFGEEPSYISLKRFKTKHPFTVLNHVMKFIDSILRSHKPYFFTYSANDPSKIPLYDKISKRICDKYGYDMMKMSDNVYYFTKKI